MAKKTSKRAKPTVIKSSGEIVKIDSRKLQCLYIYNQLKCTQLELAKFFDVCENTIKNWLKDANQVINDNNLLEMAKSRFNSFVPKALDVYDRALEIGALFPKSEHIGAAKDVLREHRVISAEESTTTNINVNVITEQRELAMEAGLNAFGVTLGNRLVSVNGNRPANPNQN